LKYATNATKVKVTKIGAEPKTIGTADVMLPLWLRY